MRKTYKVEVDCANCAAKIEEAIKKIDGVNNVRVNFMTQKLILETSGDDLSTILKQVKSCAKKVDDDAEIYC